MVEGKTPPQLPVNIFYLKVIPIKLVASNLGSLCHL